MALFIAASPLVKIFLPEWHDRLMDDPQLINDYDTPFDFWVNTGTQSIKIQFMKPQQVTGRDQNQNQSIFNWLTGANSIQHESDIYGIVEFDPKVDLIQTYDQLGVLDDFISDDPKKVKKAKEEREKLALETKNRVREAHALVRKASEKRIKQAIRLNHNNLIAQWKTNEEMKLGKYPPSISELMGAEAIAMEIEKSSAKSAKVMGRFNELMQQNPAGR